MRMGCQWGVRRRCGRVAASIYVRHPAAHRLLNGLRAQAGLFQFAARNGVQETCILHFFPGLVAPVHGFRGIRIVRV